MPRPPLLPTIEWQRVFESGLQFGPWLAQGEHPDHGSRMDADRKELPLEPHASGFLKGLGRRVHVVAIAEDWCGDVVRHVPVLQRLADESANLAVRYVKREQHLDVFARFLTNGGEAIPKFVFLSESFTECGNWGPMPDLCRELIARGKACGNVGAAREKVSALYNADPGRRMVVQELLRLIDIAATSAP